MVTKKLFRGDYLLVGITCAGELRPHDLPSSRAAPLRQPAVLCLLPPQPAVGSVPTGHRHAAVLLWNESMGGRLRQAWLTQHEACQPKARQVHLSKRRHWSSPGSSACAKRWTGQAMTWHRAGLASWGPEIWLLTHLSELRHFLPTPAMPGCFPKKRGGLSDAEPWGRLPHGGWAAQSCWIQLLQGRDGYWGAEGVGCKSGGKAQERAGASAAELPLRLVWETDTTWKMQKGPSSLQRHCGLALLPQGIPCTGDWSLAFTTKFPVISLSPTPLPFSLTPGACSPTLGMQGGTGTWPSCGRWAPCQPGDSKLLPAILLQTRSPPVAAWGWAGRWHSGCSCLPPPAWPLGAGREVRWPVAHQPLPSHRGFAGLKPSGLSRSYQEAAGDQGFISLFFFFFSLLNSYCISWYKDLVRYHCWILISETAELEARLCQKQMQRCWPPEIKSNPGPSAIRPQEPVLSPKLDRL